MKMQGRRAFTLSFKSMTQDIAECNANIDRFLSEYAVVLSFTKDASRFLTVQVDSVVRSSTPQETVQANARVST